MFSCLNDDENSCQRNMISYEEGTRVTPTGICDGFFEKEIENINV
jgi:hypothetical protein